MDGWMKVMAVTENLSANGNGHWVGTENAILHPALYMRGQSAYTSTSTREMPLYPQASGVTMVMTELMRLPPKTGTEAQPWASIEVW